MQQLELFETMKQCSKCGELKPATREYFYKSNRTTDGWRGKCIDCFAEYARERNKIPEIKERTKKRQQEYFQNLENRERKNEYQRQWRSEMTEEHKECYRAQKREYMREYDRRPESKERDREYRKWYRKLPHRRKWQKEYRDEYYQRDYVKEKNREYCRSDAHKEACKKYKSKKGVISKIRSYVIRRRARKRDLPDTLTPEQIQQMLEYFDYKCAVCGTSQDLFIKLELDHWIPLNSDDCTGTVATNIVPLCGGSEFVSHIGCNPSKRDKDATEWLIDKFGKREAKKIMKRIEDYFEWVAKQ